MKRTQRAGDTGQHHRLAHPLERRDRAGHEPRHEPALGLDESDDLRADTECCGSFRRRELDGTVDPEQAGVLARHAEHEQLSADFDLQVVVRDPPAEHLEPGAATWPDALDLSGEGAHARIRSPFGSNSGSAATTPGTHSPKISTAISVPTSCSAGRYAYAMDFFTVYP